MFAEGEEMYLQGKSTDVLLSPRAGREHLSGPFHELAVTWWGTCIIWLLRKPTAQQGAGGAGSGQASLSTPTGPAGGAAAVVMVGQLLEDLKGGRGGY